MDSFRSERLVTTFPEKSIRGSVCARGPRDPRPVWRPKNRRRTAIAHVQSLQIDEPLGETMFLGGETGVQGRECGGRRGGEYGGDREDEARSFSAPKRPSWE